MRRWLSALAGVYGLALLLWLHGNDPAAARGVAGFPTLVFLLWFAIDWWAGRAARLPEVRRQSALGFVTRRLRKSDPGFEPMALLDRVQLAIAKLLEAWEAQAEEPVAHFVSDALLERLRCSFEAQAAQGIREAARGVEVRRVGIAQLRTRGHFDALSVAVDLDGVLLSVSRSDGRELATRPIEAAGLAGFWTFVRRRGAKSRGASGLIEGVCPNCASPVPPDLHAHCRACGSVLKGGQHDWVLCEITASRHWKVLPASRAPGIAAYAEHDPGFSVQHLEDRAAVLFWRTVQAQRSRRVEPLRAGATEEFCERYAARLAEPLLEERDAVRLLAVEARGVLRGETLDTAAVEIHWSARRAGPDGERLEKRHESLLVLVRRAGVQSREGHELSSAHCPGCGAPDDRRGGTRCSFCGETLNDGSQAWVLAGMHDALSQEADELLRRIRAQ